MADFRNKLSTGLQGMGAWWSGQGPQYMVAQQRQQQIQAAEEEKRRLERQNRTKSTAVKVAHYVRLAKDQILENPAQAVSLVEEMRSGIPGAQNSQELARIKNAITMGLGPNGDARHLQAARDMLQELDNRFIASQIIEPPGAGQNTPASIQEWEYLNSLPPDEQAKFLEMKQAARLQANPEFRGGVRGEEVADVQAVEPIRTEILAGRAGEVGAVETDVAVDRQRRLAEDEAQFETAQNEPRARRAAEDAEFDMVRLGSTSDEIKELASNPRAVGFLGARFADVEGSDAYALRSKLNTLQAYAGFSRLQAMRDASPTGGALGQVSERELALLIAAYAALDPNMEREQFLAELGKFEEQVSRSWTNISKAYEETYNRPYTDDAPVVPPEAGKSNLDRLLERYDVSPR